MGVLDQNSHLYSIRGRVGSLVVSSNATTSYVKAQSVPRQPKSSAQVVQQDALISIMGAWRALSSPQRAAWSVAAALPLYARSNWFGNVYNLTGQQLFVAINRTALPAGLGLVLVPSVAAFPAVPPASSFVLNSTGSGLACSWSFLAGVPAGVVRIALRARFARGWSVLQSSFKPTVLCFRTAGAASPFNFTSYALASFGTLPLQFTIFFQTDSIDAFGRVTPGATYVQQSTGV